MELDLVPGGGPFHTPPWVGWAPDGSVLVVVLLDASGSWEDGDQLLAATLHDELTAYHDVTAWTSGPDLVARLVDAARPCLPSAEGHRASCSVLGAVIREGLVELVASGALGAVHVRREGRATPLFQARRLVDESVRQGKLRRDQVAGHAFRHVQIGPFFDGDALSLSRVRRTLGPGDRVLLGADGLARREAADLWERAGAPEIRDALHARGEGLRPAAVVTV